MRILVTCHEPAAPAAAAAVPQGAGVLPGRMGTAS